jgi:m7GpppX diphosphatase
VHVDVVANRVDDILAGLSEADTILFDSPEFVIMPDMKWDMRTMSSLYLLAIVRDGSIRSLRDLRERHLALLRAIRDEATRIVVTKWRMVQGAVRMYVHYQPSYCTCTLVCLLIGAR